MSEYYRPFREALVEAPQNLRAVFQAFDNAYSSPNNCFLDDILGIPQMPGNKKEFAQQSDVMPGEDSFMSYGYEGTDYRHARDILRFIKPSEDDVVYDIGSGYGRFVFYGALTTNAQFRGIELIKRRHENAEKIKKDFGIENAQFINENALNVDISDGTVFYMFNPFYPTAIEAQHSFEAKLQELARRKSIKIVAYAMSNKMEFPTFSKDDYTQIGLIRKGDNGIKVYQSIPQI